MPPRNLLIMLVMVVLAYACYVCGEQNPYARYVARGLAEIQGSSLERVSNEELFDGAMQAMVGVLHKQGDEHSQFIPRDEADPFRAELQQQFGGIGVRIRLIGDPPQLVVVGAPEPGTPAARADVRSGDRVLAIDGRSTDGMAMSDVLQAIRGDPGDAIVLVIQRPDADRPKTIELVREVITVDSILGDRRTADGGWEFRMDSDRRIAHVRVTTFGNKTTAELNRVLKALVAEGVEAAVLDLRDDVGGALDSAVAMCDIFLPPGLPIVETRGRDGTLHDRYLTGGNGQHQTLPLAMIVNQNSASASEIVAACMQDHQRAVVVGQRTFGKGTVQKLIPIESGRSLLKLTSASYRRPNGRNIHRTPDATDDQWGVSPDPEFEVPLTEDEYEEYRKYRNARDLWGTSPAAANGDADTPTESDAPFVDRPLEMAVEYLQGMLGQ